MRKIKERYFIREKYIYICSIERASPQDENALIQANEQNLAHMRNQHGDELTQAKYDLLRQRLEASTENCFLISLKDQICGYCHIAYADHFNSWSNLWVRLEPGQAYFFDDYVFQEYRGRGLHKFSIAQRQYIARERGCISALTIIDKSNTPSHRAYTSQGFSPTKLIWHLPVLKKNILWPKGRRLSVFKG